MVETSAIKGIGSKDAVEKAVALVQSNAKSVPQHTFSEPVEDALNRISDLVKDKINSSSIRWYAIKLFERDKEILKETSFRTELQQQIEDIIVDCEQKFDDDSESIITNERYTYISFIIKQCFKVKNKSRLTTSDKIDRIVTNRILALPIFAMVMFLIYYISISTVGTAMTDWVNDSLFGEIVPEAIGGFLESMGTAEWLSSLILDGIVAGVGSRSGFLPQMLVLFLCLAILGRLWIYGSYCLCNDRIFRKFGLSGKSFIPILVSTGCGVPGIMASRTIENDNERRMTVMTTTFMPCGAKLPIIALIFWCTISRISMGSPICIFCRYSSYHCFRHYVEEDQIICK